MRRDIPVHAAKDSMIRLRKYLESILDHWDEAAPIREDFERYYEFDCDYQIGEFKITDTTLKR